MCSIQYTYIYMQCIYLYIHIYSLKTPSKFQIMRNPDSPLAASRKTLHWSLMVDRIQRGKKGAYLPKTTIEETAPKSPIITVPVENEITLNERKLIIVGDTPHWSHPLLFLGGKKGRIQHHSQFSNSSPCRSPVVWMIGLRSGLDFWLHNYWSLPSRKTNISHQTGKGTSSSKSDFWWDMVVPKRVYLGSLFFIGKFCFWCFLVNGNISIFLIFGNLEV